MRDFIANGYISLKPDLPESFHREVYETTENAVERVGNPGNNVLPMVPEICRFGLWATSELPMCSEGNDT